MRITWGDADSAREPELAEAALSYCRSGEVVHLPRASHGLHHERPQNVSSLLLEFLAASEAAPLANPIAKGLHGR